jgi:hypothetical protein
MAPGQDRIITDIIGRPLSVGDAVAFRSPSRQSLEVGRITKITSKKVRINWTRNSYEHTQYAYPDECAKIDLDDYFAHAMANS